MQLLQSTRMRGGCIEKGTCCELHKHSAPSVRLEIWRYYWNIHLSHLNVVGIILIRREGRGTVAAGH